jgi:hypothetical protein
MAAWDRCLLYIGSLRDMAQHTSVFPILIDSRPEYLRGSKTASLLQMPLSDGLNPHAHRRAIG